jgi:hypothetical protein
MEMNKTLVIHINSEIGITIWSRTLHIVYSKYSLFFLTPKDNIYAISQNLLGDNPVISWTSNLKNNNKFS